MSVGSSVASECEQHCGLHLFEDYSIIEVVDTDNRPVPPGEPGDKVLLTALFRHTQPLIRYEVTDLVRASTCERCACGRPFAMIESIQGRTGDILYLPSPSGKEEKIYPYLFLNVFDSLPLSKWQIVHEPDGLHVFLTGVSESLHDAQVLSRLQKAFIDRGVLVPPRKIRRVEELLQNERGGKSRMIVSRIPRSVV